GRKRRRWWHLLAAIVATLIAGVTGVEVFLRAKAPELSLLDLWHRATGSLDVVTYASGRGLGLTLGIVGTILMALAALYPFQSRLHLFNPLAKTRVWMTLHIWAGILGPLFITYHTLLKLNRWPSIAFWAAWAVVLTGLSGRYIQTTFKRTVGLAELEMDSLRKERERLFDQWWGVRGRTQLFDTVDAQAALKRYPVVLMPLLLLWQQTTSWGRLLWLRYVGLREIHDTVLRENTLQNFSESARVARRRLLADTVARSVSFWQWLHLGSTVIMFVVATLHIAFALIYKAN
ncbi:MAG: hypothetical protein V3T05_11845, partial [Myxococcota bacterium]